MSGALLHWTEVDAFALPDGAMRLVHRNGGATLLVARDRLLPGDGYAEASAPTRRALSRVGAILRLRQRGRFHLHASGLVDPRGQAWLFSGDTGAGKSTLACALADAGWQVLGDDGVILERRDREVIAHPWRDALQVSAWMIPAFPRAGRVTGSPDARDPRFRVPVVAACARSAPLGGVVLPVRGTRDAMTRIAPLEALTALVRQSPWVMLGDRAAREHLDLLARLVVTTPAWRLEHTAAILPLIRSEGLRIAA